MEIDEDDVRCEGLNWRSHAATVVSGWRSDDTMRALSIYFHSL